MVDARVVLRYFALDVEPPAAFLPGGCPCPAQALALAPVPRPYDIAAPHAPPCRPCPRLLRNLRIRVSPVNQPADTHETAQLVIELPPTLRNYPPPDELEQVQAIARRFDVAARAERNRALGRAGEKRVLAHERAILAGVGRADLARHVRWVSEQSGDGAGYDIASYSPEGHTRLIEVKTTNGWERTPFHITRNELAVAENRPTEWCLLRL